LIAGLPKNDYDKLLAACDVGLIFLNKNFTIPNYPSRLLSYLEMKIPVIAATDPNSDIGLDIERNNFHSQTLLIVCNKINNKISADYFLRFNLFIIYLDGCMRWLIFFLFFLSGYLQSGIPRYDRLFYFY
jgi:hypothetical protein